jgi:hypothetical protein
MSPKLSYYDVDTWGRNEHINEEVNTGKTVPGEKKEI